MNVGILGSGPVAQALAAGFLKHGHAVTLGTRSPGKLADFLKKNPGAKTASFSDTAAGAGIVVLAVRGTAAESALDMAGAAALKGKIVLDTTNPIADAPPENGVLRFFTNLDESLMERLQGKYPDARFVKWFNSVGNALMVDPKVEGGPPTMFLCGNDPEARKTAAGIAEQFGWEPADMGRAAAARAIEPLCMLWCIPGFLRNEWNHAFKLVR